MQFKNLGAMLGRLVSEICINTARPFIPALAVALVTFSVGQYRRPLMPTPALPAIDDRVRLLGAGNRPGGSKPSKAFGELVGSDKWWLRSFIVRYLVQQQLNQPHDYISIGEIAEFHNSLYMERELADFERAAEKLAKKGFLSRIGVYYRVADKGYKHHNRECRAMDAYHKSWEASLSSLQAESAGS